MNFTAITLSVKIHQPMQYWSLKKGGWVWLDQSGGKWPSYQNTENNHKPEEHLKSIQTSETELCPN